MRYRRYITNRYKRYIYPAIINKADYSKRIDQMLEECKKEALSLYKGTDIRTQTTAFIPCEWNGIAGKSFDLTAGLSGYVINKRIIIFRSGDYEFRIEIGSDLSRESLDTYFEKLESRIDISGIVD